MNEEEREFKGRVLEALTEGYEITPQKMEQLIEEMDFVKLFDEQPEIVNEVTPESWAQEMVFEKLKKE